VVAVGPGSCGFFDKSASGWRGLNLWVVCGKQDSIEDKAPKGIAIGFNRPGALGTHMMEFSGVEW
jgi:hypothetical protein